MQEPHMQSNIIIIYYDHNAKPPICQMFWSCWHLFHHKKREVLHFGHGICLSRFSTRITYLLCQSFILLPENPWYKFPNFYKCRLWKKQKKIWSLLKKSVQRKKGDYFDNLTTKIICFGMYYVYSSLNLFSNLYCFSQASENGKNGNFMNQNGQWRVWIICTVPHVGAYCHIVRLVNGFLHWHSYGGRPTQGWGLRLLTFVSLSEGLSKHWEEESLKLWDLLPRPLLLR